MKRRKKRDSTPAQRVAQACESGGRDVDFDYDETTDVLQAAINIVKRGADVQHQKVRGVVGTLRKVSIPPPAKEATG